MDKVKWGKMDVLNEAARQLKQAGYIYQRNYYHYNEKKSNGRGARIPLVLLDQYDQPALAIVIKRSEKKGDKPRKPPRRQQFYEQVIDCPVITIWGMSDAKKILDTIESLFSP